VRTELYLGVINKQNQKAVGSGDLFCGCHRKGKNGEDYPTSCYMGGLLVKSKKTKMWLSS